MILPENIDPEIVRLFPSVKSGVVERGLWRIPVYFDKSFGRNRGCIRLRRYIVHMAETGATKKEMMDKTMEIYSEFSELIDKYPADKETCELRKGHLERYMQEFIDEVSKLIAEGDSTHLY
ncbi:Uncharacterised protein [uncultured archaeon]|nr:Uncharacterised protein [uncultured archaeon]